MKIQNKILDGQLLYVGSSYLSSPEDPYFIK